MQVTKEWIEENYVRGSVTFAELMEVLGLTKSGTYRYLKKLGVVKRPTKGRIQLEKESLKRMYVDELLSVDEIAARLNCSKFSVKEACSLFGLKRGSAFQQTEEGRSKYSKPHTEEAKEKMSKAKTKLNGQYHRGKWGTAERRYVHRRIAEESIGRKLGINEVVHHKDRDRQNNRPENLIVLSRDAHQALHIVLKRRPDINQEKWLAENEFDFLEVKNADYQSSPTYQRWYAEETGGSAVGKD